MSDAPVTVRRVSRPAALRSLPLDRHAVIDASAGTGKTFTLENLVVELVLSAGATLDEILVVTFTERATNELRVRIRAKLEELLSGEAPEASEVDVRAGDVWTLDGPALERLRRAVTTFDGGSISTIHAFCQRVLRENAFASGRLFEEQQVDARDAFGRALRDVLRRDVAGDPVRGRWLEAALNTGQSLGALEELLWKCTEAKGELRPTFVLDELDAALEAFPVEDALHGDGREALKKLGIAPASRLTAVAGRLYDTALAVERARADGGGLAFVLGVEDLRLPYLIDHLPGIDGVTPMARACRAALRLAHAAPSLAAAIAGLIGEPLRVELARRKRRAGQYDFEDMLRLLADALAGPGAHALAASLRHRFRFALVDEFQDTDETQWQIFRRAFLTGAAKPETAIFLVGDPKQSIYRFRGADVQTYESARDEVLASGGSRLRLDTSFRATADLVEAQNALFDEAAPEPFFTRPGTYSPVACGRPERVLLDGAGRRVTPVHLFRFERDVVPSALGKLVAREIARLTHPDRPWTLGGKALAYDDVYVLTRTGAEARAMGDALRTAGIPHAFYKEDGLFQTDEARELRILFAAIDEPRDAARRISAWLTPFFGLPLEHLDRARDVPTGHPLLARLRAWRAIAETHDYERLFASILRESRILRREIALGEGERALTNTLHVLEVLLEHTRRERSTLRDLVVLLAGLADRTRLPLDIEGGVQRLESDRRAVQIMTIHKAKGLEAAVVFVAGGWTPRGSDRVHIGHDGGRRFAWVGPQPDSIKNATQAEEREEDQRLMYVALTRARGRLYLPSIVKGSDPPGPRPRRTTSRGSYEPVNRRVAALAESPLFSSEDAPRAGMPSLVPARDASSGDWLPSPALLASTDAAPRHAAILRAQAGAVLTSYTRMKGSAEGASAAWSEEARERRAGKAAREVVADSGPVPLRSARTSGVFVHEVLEQVPLGSYGARGFDAWRADTEVGEVFSHAMSTHRIDPAEREHAERMVWAAYDTPIDLPGGGRLPGIARASGVVREMDFVFPVSSPGGPSKQARTYVRGSIDLAFEHRGLTYFVDWKTDSLSAYDTPSLGRHVAGHYEEQLELYALATVKLLGIETREDHAARFGGLLYLFLRGLGDPTGGDGADRAQEGVWSARPTWADVTAWDDALGARARRP